MEPNPSGNWWFSDDVFFFSRQIPLFIPPVYGDVDVLQWEPHDVTVPRKSCAT